MLPPGHLCFTNTPIFLSVTVWLFHKFLTGPSFLTAVSKEPTLCLQVGWFVVLRINVDLAIFPPYLDLEAGDNQSLKIQVARPGIEPRSSCPASQELNHSATAAPYMPTGFEILRGTPTVGRFLLQAACTSMPRHIYSWNIFDCNVKPQINLEQNVIYVGMMPKAYFATDNGDLCIEVEARPPPPPFSPLLPPPGVV